MMEQKILDDYTDKVCAPRKHKHPTDLRSIIECASGTLAEA